MAPGNAGTAQEKKISNISIASEDIPELISFAKEELIDISIVGPEAPLFLELLMSLKMQALLFLDRQKKPLSLRDQKYFVRIF